MDILGLDKKIDEMRTLVAKACLEGGELFEMSLNVEDLEHKIMSSIRFAMFSLKGLEEEDSPFTSMLKSDRGDAKALLHLNVSEVVQLNELFDGHSPLQKSMDLEKLGNKSVKVYFDYERSHPSVRVERCEGFDIDMQEVLKRWECLPVLPPIDTFLDLDAIDSDDTYMWEISDAYEEWKWEIEGKMFGNRFIQIGGWPHWVQDGDDEKFVARINNEWGDGGSVYLYYDEDTHKFSVTAQTC